MNEHGMPCSAFYFAKSFQKVDKIEGSVFMKYLTEQEEVKQEVGTVTEATEVEESGNSVVQVKSKIDSVD